jgi:hypothetical protein
MAANKATGSSDPNNFLDAVATKWDLLAQRMLPKEVAATEIG